MKTTARSLPHSQEKPRPEFGTTRRTFLRNAALWTAVGWSSNTLAAQTSGRSVRTPSPNSRIHLGLIGCGGMGRGNLANCAKHEDVVITAACDVQAGRLAATVDQFTATCRGYTDYREMLQQRDLDAVIIATPPHWHCLQAIAACEAGKAIYLQKPMTLHLGESLALRNAVERHGIISQVGTQMHASDNYRRVVEFIRSGHLGPIGTVRTFNVMNQGTTGVGRALDRKAPKGVDWDRWCGPAPYIPYHPILAASAYHHCSWMDYSGGWTPGMAPHIIDLPIWAMNLGYPLMTCASGGRFVIEDDGDAYDHHEVVWRYPKMTLTWMSSLTNSYGFDFHGDPVPKRRLGTYFHGLNGTLQADYGMFKVVPEGEAMRELAPPTPSLDPSPGHEREWLDCIKSRRQPSCSVAYHVRVDVPVALSLLSLKLGRSIRFNPDKEVIEGDDQAARMSVPEYRAPWKFPSHYLA